MNKVGNTFYSVVVSNPNLKHQPSGVGIYLNKIVKKDDELYAKCLEMLFFGGDEIDHWNLNTTSDLSSSWFKQKYHWTESLNEAKQTCVKLLFEKWKHHPDA